jgi:hypothetical protein
MALVVSASRQCAGAEFVYYTGDDMPHDLYNMTSNALLVRSMTGTAKALADIPGSPKIIAALGNHNVFPVDQAPFPPMEAARALYGELFSIWREHGILGPEHNATFLKGGYYRTDAGHVTVLSLNTILWYDRNALVSDADEDPAEQLAWLEAQLADVRGAGGVAHIIGHVPPGYVSATGSLMMRSSFNDRFLTLLRLFNEVVKCSFFGHLHSDSFRLFPTSNDDYMLLLLAPSVTPWANGWVPLDPGGLLHSNNPGVRMMDVASDGSVEGFVQWSLDLEAANAGKPAWVPEYTAGGRARDFFDLLVSMSSPESLAFKTYFARKLVMTYPVGKRLCGESCWGQEICSIAVGMSKTGEWDACIHNPGAWLRTLPNLRERDEQARGLVIAIVFMAVVFVGLALYLGLSICKKRANALIDEDDDRENLLKEHEGAASAAVP